MLQLKDVDSSKLLFDVHSDALEQDLRAALPEFAAYAGKFPRQVFQYIILMYDLRTPMLHEAPDYFSRKYLVASMVGLPKTKQGFTPETEDIILGGDESVNGMIVAYLFQFAMPEYTSLMLYDAMLGLVAQSVLRGTVNKDTGKLIEDATRKKQELTRAIFKSGDYDEFSALRNALYARVEKQKVKLRPEQIIREFEATGQLPDDFCPYGEELAEELRDVSMSFIGDKPPTEKRKRGRPRKIR